MNNLSSVFKTHKKMGMTEEEKKKVWDAISTHTFDVPSSSSLHVRNASSSRLYYRGLLPNLSLGATLSTTRGYALGLLVGSLVLSGGLSAFAQDSLPGDLLYFGKGKRVTHIGIYVGDGRYVHAANRRTGIVESELPTSSSTWWHGARRVIATPMDDLDALFERVAPVTVATSPVLRLK